MVDCFFFGHLPSEIISLILIKLPVKTLLTLKCVCRYFYRFVSCPDFIKEQLKFSTKDVSMSSYNLMYREVYNYRELKITSIRSLWCEFSVNLFNLEYPQSELQDVQIVGSCNGLVVIIVNDEHFFIWNPTIRKHEKLPTIVGYKYLGSNWIDPPFLCGFGFDASNDDYKVVALFKLYPGSTSTNDIYYAVYVYSLKRSSWIRIPDFSGEKFQKFDKFHEPFAKFVCGKLHWTSYNNQSIISFDVEREVFGTLEQPTHEDGYRFKTLTVLGGLICLCCDHITFTNMWVMKEYGIKESWTKIFTLSDDDHFCFPLALSIMPNGELLIDDESYLDFYNPKDDSRRSIEIRPDHSVIYVESLISPCSDLDINNNQLQ